MGFHVPEEECLDPAGIERLQRRKLAAMFTEVLPANSFYRRKFDGIAFDPFAGPLESLPFTTRAELQEDQSDHPPYGHIHTYPPERYHRLHQTSGSAGEPLRCLDTLDSWRWWSHCWGIVFRGAGLTDDDRVMFPFSFGPFIGFWAGFEAASSLGNLTLPAGGMTTSARLRHLIDNRVTVVCCTPTYALRMAEIAAGDGLDLAGAAVRLLIVAGEPGGSIASVRARIASAWGARVIDHPGLTEVGAWGFECAESSGGVHVIESEFIAEVIDPDSGRTVPDGQSGELVLTNLGRAGMPVIRYRTGDEVALTRGQCACGRHFARAEGGVRGRIDDMLLVRGNNVFPSAIEGMLREFDEVAEFRLTCEGAPGADLRIDIEPAPGAQLDGLAGRIENAIRDRLHFRPLIALVDPGALPRFEMKSQRVVRRE